MSTLYSQLLADPAALVSACYDDAFRFTPQQIHDIQLSGARRRFGDMRAKIPVLERLAAPRQPPVKIAQQRKFLLRSFLLSFWGGSSIPTP